MPTYAVTVEDAQYQVDAPDENTAWQWAYMTHQQRPAPKQSTVLSELKRGFKQFGSSTQTGLEALTSPEEAAKAGVERAQRISEEAGEGVSFAPVREAYEKQGILSALGEVASQVPRAVAGMAPAAAATIAGGKAGALAGTAAAPVLGPFAPVGPIAGGLLGAGAALYGSMAGSNIERQAQEQMEAGKPVSIDRPAAYGTAVGQTALEAVGTGAILGKRLVKGVLGIADDAKLATDQARQALIKEAQRSMLGATGMGAVRGATEIPVEIAQAVLERAQAGLDVLSPEAYDEYGATAYQAALGGAGMGALTGVPSRGQARAELAQIQPSARQEAQNRILAAQAAPRGFTKKGEGGQGLLFTPEELEGLEKPEVELPTDLDAIQEEFNKLERQAPTPETQARMATLAQQYETLKAKQPEAPAPAPEQLTLGFPTAESPAAAQQELDLLKKQNTPEAKARKEELKGFIRAAEEQARAEAPKGYTKEGQGRLFTPTEMRESGLKRMREPTEAEPTAPTPGQLRQAGQKQLKFTPPAEAKGEAKPVTGTAGIAGIEEEAPTREVTEPVPEPTLAPKRAVPPELQPVMDKLTAAGVRPEVQAWAESGRNRPFLRKLMDMAPEAAPQARKALKLKEGSEKAEVFDALFPTPGVPAFEPAPGTGESRLGLLGQLGITPAAPAPRARKPVGRGVVPAGGVAPAAAPAEGKPAAALKPKAYPSLPRAEQYWNDTATAVGGKKKPFSELTPAQRGAWREAVQAEDAQTLREEYTRIAGEKAKEQPSKAEETKAARKKALEAEVRETRRAKEEEPPLFEAVSTLTREPSVYGAEAQRSPSLSRTIAALRRRLDEGKLTPEEFAVRVERAHDAYKLAQGEKTRQPRERGADYIRERLLGAKRRGEFDEQEVDLAEWFIGKNPALLDDLAISIVKSDAESSAAGKYGPLYRLMTLFKDAEADGTIVHEILHHLERMMPAEVQAGIRKAWLTSLERASKAAQRGTDPALNEFYQNLQAFHTSETGTVKNFTAAVNAIKDGQVSKKHYQHVNPSEFWAENGTDIVQRRFAASNSIVARLKQWLSELGQKLKSTLGLSSKAPIIRALDSLAKADGKFVSDKMLMEGVPLYSISPTEGIAAQSELMKDAPSSLKKSLSDMLRIVGEKDDVPFTTRFRVEVADVAASVVNRLNILFDGKVRDEITGLTNPELLIRQAQATEALFNGFLASGGIEKDPTTGQYIVTDKPGPGGSVADMLAAIKNWSDAKGMDFKLGYAEASKMLEARRLDAMRQENVERKKKGQDLFPIHKLALDDKRDADEQIDAALRGLKANPDIQKVADMMDQQRAYMIDKMVAVGRISKDTAQEWKDAAGYVPFDRVEDFFEKYIPKRTSGRGLAQLGSLPQFVGTTQREVGNVFDNHTKLMGWMLKQTLKQDATFTTMNVLADLGMAKRLYGNQAAATNKNNVVATYKNGQKQYFEVRSHWDAVAFRDAPEVKATIWKAFAAVSNILRKIVTVMPPFVAKQVTDDIQRAFITSGVREPSKLIVPAVTNFLRIAGHELVFGKDHPFTKEFAKKGLVGDIDYNASNPAETVLFNMGYSKRSALSALHHRLEAVTRASDLAMRKAIYDRTMKEENEDVGLATARAREFINFRRRGASKTVGIAIATIPFFNAYLQSSDLLLRSLTGRGSSNTERAVAKRLFWTQAAKMTTFALIYALANSDDEEYDKLSFEEKANNWVVDGKKLPAPGDMAALFKVPAEALVHYMGRQGTKEEQLTSEVVKQVLGYTYEQFVGRVTPVPQAIRPVAEALMNHSMLTGRPLVGTYQKGLPEEFQTVSTTSELAKAIAKFSHNNIVDPITGTPLDLSPIVIDNTLRGYLGGAVPLMNMLIDQMVNPNKTDRPLSRYWFLGQYLTPEVPSGPKDEFYDLVNRVMPVKRALDKLANTDIDAAMKYYEKNADKLKMAELVNTALQTVRQTRQYINWLDSADGAKQIESGAERLKLKQEAEQYLNDNLEWVRAAKAQIFGNKD
jgi:hypothetical protein